MSLTVTQRPNQYLTWVAAKNPVLYKMTRKDYIWTTLVTSTGNTSIQIATNVTAHFVAGDSIWLQADDGAYSATGTVISSAFGAATTVITTVPYVANNAAGYINTLTQRLNYYVGSGVYKSADNTLIGTVNNTPAKIGVVTIDVAIALQSVLDPSISSIVDGVILQDTNITEGYYIKYTEYWTGSAESTTDDSGSATLFAIYGARQIGDSYGGYYQDYLSTNLYPLSKFDSMAIALGEYYCLSWISESILNTYWLKKTWYDASATILCITYIKNTNNTTAYAGITVPRSVYTIFHKLVYTESITPDRNINNIGTIAWTSNTLLLATGTTSKSWVCPFFLAQTKTITFSYDFTLLGNGTNVTPHLYLFDSTGTALTGSVIIFTGSNGTYTGTGTITNSGSGDGYFIGFDFANATGANKTLTMNSLVINIPSTPTRLDLKVIRLNSSTTYSETANVTNTITANIITCTKNPVTLMWRNSLGGESSWTFNFSQDYAFKFPDPTKNKWYILYEQNLTLAQYNALNDLFTLGQIYQTPLTELTTSIDKTEARVGQQVYIVASDGTKTGVIVQPTENRTLTKKNRHSIQIPILLPDLF